MDITKLNTKLDINGQAQDVIIELYTCKATIIAESNAIATFELYFPFYKDELYASIEKIRVHTPAKTNNLAAVLLEFCQKKYGINEVIVSINDINGLSKFAIEKLEILPEDDNYDPYARYFQDTAKVSYAKEYAQFRELWQQYAVHKNNTHYQQLCDQKYNKIYKTILHLIPPQGDKVLNKAQEQQLFAESKLFTASKSDFFRDPNWQDISPLPFDISAGIKIVLPKVVIAVAPKPVVVTATNTQQNNQPISQINSEVETQNRKLKEENKQKTEENRKLAEKVKTQEKLRQKEKELEKQEKRLDKKTKQLEEKSMQSQGYIPWQLQQKGSLNSSPVNFGAGIMPWKK